MKPNPYRDERRWLNLNSGLKFNSRLRGGVLGVAVIVTHAVVGVPANMEACQRGHLNLSMVLKFWPFSLLGMHHITLGRLLPAGIVGGDVL